MILQCVIVFDGVVGSISGGTAQWLVDITG